MNIKERLKKWRIDNGKTHQQMATLFGCCKTTAISYESTQPYNSRIPTLKRIQFIEMVTGGEIEASGWFELSKEQAHD